jgi:hypothetical protein
MGMPKAIRKQAITAERAATQAADTFVADQMKTQRIKAWLNIYPDSSFDSEQLHETRDNADLEALSFSPQRSAPR